MNRSLKHPTTNEIPVSATGGLLDHSPRVSIDGSNAPPRPPGSKAERAPQGQAPEALGGEAKAFSSQRNQYRRAGQGTSSIRNLILHTFQLQARDLG